MTGAASSSTARRSACRRARRATGRSPASGCASARSAGGETPTRAWRSRSDGVYIFPPPGRLPVATFCCDVLDAGVSAPVAAWRPGDHSPSSFRFLARRALARRLMSSCGIPRPASSSGFGRGEVFAKLTELAEFDEGIPVPDIGEEGRGAAVLGHEQDLVRFAHTLEAFSEMVAAFREGNDVLGHGGNEAIAAGTLGGTVLNGGHGIVS